MMGRQEQVPPRRCEVFRSPGRRLLCLEPLGESPKAEAPETLLEPQPCLERRYTIGLGGNMDRANNVRPLALSLTVLGALIRLIPHPPNFAPVGGMSLYAGARLRGWQAFALPLVLMAVTDPLMGGYSVATPLIYCSFLINVWIGRRLQSTESPLRIGAACLACSVQFFLISNFGTWLGSYYAHTWSGAGALLHRGHPILLAYAGQRPVLQRRALRPACVAEPHIAHR